MSEPKRPRRPYKKRESPPTENDRPLRPVRPKIQVVSSADPEIVQNFRHLITIVNIMGYEIVKR